MTILTVTPRSPRRFTIVYVARADGDGERAAVFRWPMRAHGIGLGLWHEKHDDSVLIVEDDDLGAWPEILEDFEHHACDWRLSGTLRWSVCRACPKAQFAKRR